MSAIKEQTPITSKEPSTPDVILDVQQTTCCIVLRDIVANLLAFGVKPPHLKPEYKLQDYSENLHV